MSALIPFCKRSRVPGCHTRERPVVSSLTRLMNYTGTSHGCEYLNLDRSHVLGHGMGYLGGHLSLKTSLYGQFKMK